MVMPEDTKQELHKMHNEKMHNGCKFVTPQNITYDKAYTFLRTFTVCNSQKIQKCQSNEHEKIFYRGTSLISITIHK
jgi:hypothetical protein